MDELIVERRDRVLHVTLNRPERKNALSIPMWRELARLLARFDSDDEDRVMVLSGAGGDFCVGGDISGSNPSGSTEPSSKERSGHEDQQDGDVEGSLETMKSTVSAVCLGIHQASKPVIAAVDGIAAGAGANVALGCDLVLASPRARFSEIFIRRGLSIDSGGTWLLPRLIGLHKAKQLAFFGDWVDAEEAHAMGLVNRVVPGEALLDEAHAWAARLATSSPLALAVDKDALNRAFELSFEEALDLEARGLGRTMRSPEAQELIRAFFEKRSAKG